MHEETLSENVQNALRAELGRHNMSRRTLAERLGRNNDWTSRRIAGDVPITLDDLDAMCRELGVKPVIELRPISPKKTTAGRSTGRRSRTQPPSGEGSE